MTFYICVKVNIVTLKVQTTEGTNDYSVSDVKYGHNLPFCSFLVVLNNGQKCAFAEHDDDVAVRDRKSLHFDQI